MGLSTLLTVLQDRRERSRPGASPLFQPWRLLSVLLFFPKCGATGSGQVGRSSDGGRGTRDESFIYAMSADERGRDLRVSSPASPARAPAVSSVLALPGGKDTRSGNADRAYNTLHFAGKVVCQRASPFGNPGQQNRLNIPHFPGA